MQLTSTQKLILAISIALLGICCWFFPNQKQPTFRAPSSPPFIPLDTVRLFQKKVMPNRLPSFIQYLNLHGIPIQNNFELLLLLSNPTTRQNIHRQFQIDTNVLLLYAEIADLMQIEITELDAQILFFSQRNYQNQFTGSTMNLQILAEVEAESILEDMGGWMAGNENPLLQNYCLSIEDIESWNSQANAYQFKILVHNP